MSIFEKASREKFRFKSTVGELTVEDLWDLPLTSLKGANLNSIAVNLHNELASRNTVSFVDETSTSVADDKLRLAFEVVKHIIDVKKTERDAARLEKASKERRQEIMAIIEKKKREGLENLPIEELEKLL